MSWTREIESCSVSETLLLGQVIAGALEPGAVVALVGQLGAGKTHLAKGIAVGLGVANEKLVNSPTFVLLNQYPARNPLAHVDAYRLADPEQLAAIGFEELCSAGGVVLVEWADRVESLMPSEALWIELGITGETARSLSLRTSDQVLAARLDAALDRWRRGGDKTPDAESSVPH